MEEKVEGWQYLVAIMAVLAGQQPQTAYAGLKKSLQEEWYFVQRITPDIGLAF